MNFGRYYLRLYLQHMGVHQELIKFRLGHWVIGEIPLEILSSFSMAESISMLQPLLDNMLSESLNYRVTLRSMIKTKNAENFRVRLRVFHLQM